MLNNIFSFSFDQKIKHVLFDGWNSYMSNQIRPVLMYEYDNKQLIDFYMFDLLVRHNKIKNDDGFILFLHSIRRKFVFSGITVFQNTPSNGKLNNLHINEFIYTEPYNKMGLFIKKQLKREFNKLGLSINEKSGFKSSVCSIWQF